jgi:hypothetical protein
MSLSSVKMRIKRKSASRAQVLAIYLDKKLS